MRVVRATASKFRRIMSAVGTILFIALRVPLRQVEKQYQYVVLVSVSTQYFLETSAVVCTNYTCSLHKLQP